MNAAKRHVTHPRAILIIACVAQFMVVLDVTIVNISLPSMREALHLTPAGQQWIINAYTLVFGGFLLLGGRAADLYGRRRVFLFGLALFSGASLVGGLASSGEVLIIARAVQGLGAAVLAPATLSSLTTTFAEGPARTRALTAWSTTAATGGAFGTVLGGVITDQLNWRWVLFVNVPIGIALFATALRYLHLPQDRGPRRSLDLPGSVTITAGLATLIYAIVTTDVHPWGSPHTLGLMAIGFGLIALFVFIEARADEPLVPADLPEPRAGRRRRDRVPARRADQRPALLPVAVPSTGQPLAPRRGARAAAPDVDRVRRGADLGADRRSRRPARAPDRRPALLCRRIGLALPDAGGRQLRGARRPPGSHMHLRHRVLLRADDGVRHRRRRLARRGARVGPAQQLASDRRRAAAGDPRDGRGEPYLRGPGLLVASPARRSSRRSPPATPAACC